MTNAIRSTALLAFSLLIAFMFAELVVRWVEPQDLSGSWRVTSDSGLLMNKSSGAAVHSLRDIRVKYQFGQPGLRNSQVQPDAQNILVLGDSFTFGWLLSEHQTYVSQLQANATRRFRDAKFNFVNAAAGGWGAAHYVAYAEEFGALANPTLVLVFLNFADVGRSVRSGLWMVDRNKVRRNSLPVSSLKRIVNGFLGYQFLLESSHLMQLARKFVVSVRSREPAPHSASATVVKKSDHADAIRLGEALFRHLADWSKQHSAQLVVLTTGWHQSISVESQDPSTQAFMTQAEAFFAQNNIAFFPLEAVV